MFNRQLFAIFIALLFLLNHGTASAVSPDSLSHRAVGSITKLVLYDADSDQVITAFDPLLTGTIVSTTSYGTNFSIVAEVTGTVGSVVFALDGTDPYRTESVAPYALNGDNNGNFAIWTPAIGSHTVSATPYSLGGSNGEKGATFEITFEVSDGSGGGNTPPVASFTATPLSGDAPLLVNFDASASNPGETDGSDAIDQFGWDYGDETTGAGETASHTYVTPGSYITLLTVTDLEGATSTAQKTIIVNDPDAGSGGPFIESGGLVSIEGESFFTHLPVGIDIWEVKTTASSSNPAPSGYSGSATMYAADDATQSNFSPGLGSELTYEVTFTTPGTYYFWTRVWADDHNSNRIHGGIEGNWQVGEDTKASYIVEWTYDSWQWTNDRASTGNQAYLLVDTPGTYTINIWLQKDGLFFDKLVLMTEDVSIEVLEGTGPAESPRETCETNCNTSPTADFSATPGTSEFEIDFDGTLSSDPEDGDIDTYEWFFGDGSTGAGSNVSHSYSSAGTYSVQLIVYDLQGASGTITKDVVVEADGGGTGTGAFLEQSGQVVMEAENAQNYLSGGGDSWTVMTDKSGFSGVSTMQALPNNGTLINSNYTGGGSPEMTFDVQLSQGGQFWVWVRMWAANDQDNSVHAGYNGTGPESGNAMEQTTYNSWQWTRNRKNASTDAYLDVTSGLHTVSIWMREDGVYIDKVLLTNDESYTPTGSGPAESPRDDGTGGNLSPIASFTSTDTGLSVDFVSTSTDPDGAIDTWAWDFGDGGTASTETKTHTYTASGTYTVALTVQDMEGASDTETQSITVTEGTNSPPNIVWTANPGTTVTHGETITFDAGDTTDPDGDAPLTYQWFKVDGSIETLVGSIDVYIHTAATAGTSEIVRLKVGDGALTSTEDITITLQEATTKTYYYLKDHLGSIRATVDEKGIVVSYSDFYPFGMEMPGRNTIHGTDRTRENYTGHELDTETGLVYAGARYLMPEIGRWMSVDPLADDATGWSSYNYVFNNPNTLTDPDGRMPCCNTGLNSTGALLTYLKALAGDKTAQKAVKTHIILISTVTSAGVGGASLARRLLGFVLSKPTTSAVIAKEVVDFSAGLFSDAPDPEGFGGGTIGQGLRKTIEPTTIFEKHFDDIINIINQADRTGSKNAVLGGLAGAIRHTKQTGELIGGTDHIIKGRNTVKALKKRLKRVKNAIDLSDDQRSQLINTTQSKIDEIQEALDFIPE